MHGLLFLKNRVRIGAGESYVANIDNPNDKYTKILKALKLGISRKEALAHPEKYDLSKAELKDCLKVLENAGYLEDEAIQPPVDLTGDNLERYKVNLNFFSTLENPFNNKFKYQEKLKNATVLIIGLGGIGSNICIALLELGIGKIIATDFDEVDLSNLNRQILYSEKSVGKLKSEEAKKRANEFNSYVQFETIHQEISSQKDVQKIITVSKPDFVVNVADYPTGYIDFWVNQACVEKKIPLIAALVDKKNGRVYTVIPGKTACYNCQYVDELNSLPQHEEEVMATRVQKNSEKLDLYRSPNGALGPACLFQGYFVSFEIMRYLFWGAESMLTFNKRFSIDFLSFEQKFTPLKKLDDCEVCGGIVNE
ncbi:thiamine biosynthesis protein (thiF) [Pediococcus cellicola]|uniref:Thiamine biosynthesis protein (ThiF) n=1 Tax=Pediococcus cellicola TaxID=319652 RepID=A0A0R2IPD3_9LACO|nr:thiamine biosynthesis protein (thiF) [Pediococcus cellicola]